MGFKQRQFHRFVKKRLHHIFFVGSVTTLLVLGSWWTIFLLRNVEEIHKHRMDKLALEGRLVAQAIRGTGDVRLPDESKFEIVAPTDEGDGHAAEGFVETIAPGRLLRPKQTILDGLEHRYRMDSIQVFGEGMLFFFLILVTIFMLYYMVLVEGRVLDGMENFLSTVTHELKTPIAGMKALLQTLGMRSLSEEKRRQYIEMGLQESAKLQHLVENVLAANRLGRDQMPISLQPVRLRSLLDREVENQRLVFGDSAQLTLHCDEDLMVKADPEALHIVLENLIENAYKYSPVDPRITIRTERNGNSIRLSVIDKGIGLDESETERIFEKFYRASGEDVKAKRGSGLGLFIAKSLVHSMDGELQASSRGRGQGSTFSMRLRAWR